MLHHNFTFSLFLTLLVKGGMSVIGCNSGHAMPYDVTLGKAISSGSF